MIKGHLPPASQFLSAIQAPIQAPTVPGYFGLQTTVYRPDFQAEWLLPAVAQLVGPLSTWASTTLCTVVETAESRL